MNKLTDHHVSQIRKAKLTDSYWSRRLRVDTTTIYHARIGRTYRHVATEPDLAPREGGGRLSVLHPIARPARIRRQWL